MTDPVYEELIDALNRLPSGFPRTLSRVELRLLQRLFTPEEARLAAGLTRHYQSVDAIAERLGLDSATLKPQLVAMAKRGLIWCEKRDTALFFRLAPFVVGIYEAQLESLDHELAHLVEKYLHEGGAAGIMKPQPALHRVVPAQKAVKSEWALPW